MTKCGFIRFTDFIQGALERACKTESFTYTHYGVNSEIPKKKNLRLHHPTANKRRKNCRLQWWVDDYDTSSVDPVPLIIIAHLILISERATIECSEREKPSKIKNFQRPLTFDKNESRILNAIESKLKSLKPDWFLRPAFLIPSLF